MAKTAYAVFQSPAAADRVASQLTGRTQDRASFSVQSHRAGTIDTSVLPDSATETGRNTAMAMAIGGAVGACFGAGLGSAGVVMGLGSGLGTGLGLLVGVLSGLLCGMMAGTRRPKARLRAVMAGLEGEQMMLTVEVHDRCASEYVQQQAQALGAVDFGDC